MARSRSASTASREPPIPDRDPFRAGADDALRALEERLGRASEAAERLIAEAIGTARSAAPAQPAQPDPTPETATEPQTPPPAGWQAPSSGRDEQRGDLELLLALIQSVRDLVPPELQRRLAEALRELLLALRALIDWYLERSEQRRSTTTEVQDIPIS